MTELQNDKEFALDTENTNQLNNINHVTIIDATSTENDNQNVLENNECLKESIFSDSNVLYNNIDNKAPEPNCLALTVRKDYNLIIVKNIFTASGRLSWKIVLATVVLNFLNMLF